MTKPKPKPKPKPQCITLTIAELDEMDRLIDGIRNDAAVTLMLRERLDRLNRIITNKRLKLKYNQPTQLI